MILAVTARSQSIPSYRNFSRIALRSLHVHHLEPNWAIGAFDNVHAAAVLADAENIGQRHSQNMRQDDPVHSRVTDNEYASVQFMIDPLK